MNTRRELTHAEHLVTVKPLLQLLANLPEMLLHKEEGGYVYASLLSSFAYYLDAIFRQYPQNWQQRFQMEFRPLIDEAVKTQDFRKLNEFLVRFYLNRLQEQAEDRPEVHEIIGDLRHHLNVVAKVLEEGPSKKLTGEAAYGVTLDDTPDWWLSVCETDALEHLDEV